MIIEKRWSKGEHHKYTFAAYKGWFLFGIIPIYIKQMGWYEGTAYVRYQ